MQENICRSNGVLCSKAYAHNNNIDPLFEVIPIMKLHPNCGRFDREFKERIDNRIMHTALIRDIEFIAP